MECISYAIKPFEYLAAVFFLFVVVTLIFCSKLDTDAQAYCDDAVHEFVDKSRTAGYISSNNYMEMVQKLGATGNVYDINVIHSSKVVYPGEQTESGAGNDYNYNYNVHTTDEILDKLFESETQTYQMKNGDELKVSFFLKEPTLSGKMMSFILRHSYKSIRGSYSGLVGSSGEMGL